jgi:hypothetical protein
MMRRFVVVPALPKPGDDVLASVKKYGLEQNYPNPFNPSTSIKFAVENSGFVTLKVYDVLGNEVKNLISQNLAPGSYDISFDASDLAAGMYVYQLNYENKVESKKMLLVK